MNIIKTTALSFICAFILIGTAHAQENTGLKLGFGFDRGFGIAGSTGKLNGFIGNDGIAIDYIFTKGPLQIELKGPVSWYIGAGGYGDWDGDLGVRLPVGAEWGFAKRWDTYAQVIPRLRVNNTAKFGLDFGIGVRYQF